jgi:hypothetical protein
MSEGHKVLLNSLLRSTIPNINNQAKTYCGKTICVDAMIYLYVYALLFSEDK